MGYRFGDTPDAYMRTPGALSLLPNVPLTITDATTAAPVTGLKDGDGNTVTTVSTDSNGEFAFTCDSPVVMIATSTPPRVWGPFYSPDAVGQVLTIMPSAASIAAAASAAATAAEAAQAAAEAAAAAAGGGSGVLADNAVTTPKLASASVTPTKLDRAYLEAGANLTDVGSAATARSALGLGAAATKAVGTTSGTVAAGDDSRFTSALANAATADAKAVLALTASTEPVTYVATADASAGSQAAATSARVLPASGTAGLAAALKTILEANKRVVLLRGPSTALTLDAQLVVNAQDGSDWDFGGLALKPWSGENNGGNSGQAGIIFGGGAATSIGALSGFPTTIGQGLDTIAHTTSALPTACPAGSWQFITSTENRNPNRPLEYFKGEIVQTLTSSSTSWTLSNPTRDTYTSSLITVRSVPMVTGLRISNLTVMSNTANTNRQNGLVIRNVAGIFMDGIYVTGDELADGLGLWGCVGGEIEGRSYRCLDRYGPGVQGYGYRLAGSEGIGVDWDDTQSRHGGDLGMSSSQWPVTRHTLIRRHVARYTYAAGFAIHDAEYTHTLDGAIKVLNCGGGIIVRGSYTRLLRPVVLGGQAVTYPYGSGTQSNGEGIQVGERTKQTLSAFDDTSANGYGGIGLEIIEPVIDLRGANGDLDGINVEDPLVNARIICTTSPIRPRRAGFKFSGDYITDSVIDIAVDHTTGTGGTGSYGPPSGTTYTGVTLTSSTGDFDTGGAVPSVGTELISTGGTPASSTPAGWGGFVPGATYFVYSVSGTTFKVASRASGNTAAISFTQNLTGLSFVVGKRVHSAYIVPSVSSVNQQFIRRSKIRITSTACRDVPVVIGGARNSGTSYRNRLDVTVTSLGSGPTASTPVVRWAGTSLGEWEMGPVDATPHNRSALHAAYTGLTRTAGGLTIRYNDQGVGSRFLEGVCSLSLARYGGATRQRPGASGKHTRDYSGSVTATALVVGDIGVVRAIPVRIIDRLIGGITVGVGPVPVLNTATYLRFRMAVFADSGDGITPTTTKLADLGTIDLVTGSANTARTFTLGTPLWDGAWDVEGNGIYHLAYVVQADGTAGSQVTTFPTIPFASNVNMSDPADVFSNVSARGWSSTNTQLTDAGTLGSVSGWSRDSSPRSMPFLIVDATTMAGVA